MNFWLNWFFSWFRVCFLDLLGFESFGDEIPVIVICWILKLTGITHVSHLSLFHWWLDNLVVVIWRIQVSIVCKSTISFFIVWSDKILMLKFLSTNLNLWVWALICPSVKFHLILPAFTLNPGISLQLIFPAQLWIFGDSYHTVLLNVHNLIQYADFLIKFS